MPKDNIERAIKKAPGELEGVTYEEVTFEVTGRAAHALFVEVLTDKSTHIAEIRSISTSTTQPQSGAVAWKFDRKGVIEIPKAGRTRCPHGTALEGAPKTSKRTMRKRMKCIRPRVLLA